MRTHPGKDLKTILSTKSLRSDVQEKLVEVLKKDDHPDRKPYARELAAYAQEVLSGLSAAYELNPSAENLDKLSLRYAVAVFLGPREEYLQKEQRSSRRMSTASEREPTWRSQWDDERAPRRERQPRYNRVATMHDSNLSGPESAASGGETDDEGEPRVAFVDSARPKRDDRGREPSRQRDVHHRNEKDRRPQGILKTSTRDDNRSQDRDRGARSPAPTNNRRFIDFIKLMKMNHLEARQAWPADAALSGVAQDFVTRPVDREHSIFAEDACKHCYYFRGDKDNAAHLPTKCRHLMMFIASKESLKHLLVELNDLTRRK